MGCGFGAWAPQCHWGRSRAPEQVLEERVGLGQPGRKGGQVVGVGCKRTDEGGRAHLVRISGSGSGAGGRDSGREGAGETGGGRAGGARARPWLLGYQANSQNSSDTRRDLRQYHVHSVSPWSW